MKQKTIIFIQHIVVCSFTFIFGFGTVAAQNSKHYKIHTVAFYNVENLFDTINDPNKYDEKSPMMELKHDRSAVYQAANR